MIYYMIRHIKSGKFMPLIKGGRGYTHWNPGTNNKIVGELDIPRLISTLCGAKLIISLWATQPNASVNYDSNYRYGKLIINYKEDNRSKDDLEVVEVKITEVYKNETRRNSR